MTTDVWTVTKAKARFSELIAKAYSDGPQTITRKGRAAVVVVSAKAWRRKTTRRVGNLAEFFAASPLRGSKLKVWEGADKNLAPRIRGDGSFRKRQSR